MTREEARELLMQLLFQMDVRKDYTPTFQAAYIEQHFQTKQHREHANQLISAITEHLEEIDSMLNQTAKHWNTKRMAKVDLAVCRLALGEIFYSDTPDAVVINEAVNIAKKYGAEDSHKFINGILGTITKEKNG